MSLIQQTPFPTLHDPTTFSQKAWGSCTTYTACYASGRLTLGAHQGPQRYLSDVEEEALVSFVLGCADVGYPKTVKQVSFILVLAFRDACVYSD